MKLKSIIIICDGGLANRIRPIFSGLALASRLGLSDRSLKIFWKPTSVCEAELADILNLNLNCIDSIHDTDLGEVGYFAREGCVKNAINLFERTEILDLELRYERRQIENPANVQKILLSGATTYDTLILFDNQPLELGDDFKNLYIEKLGALRFSDSVESEAKHFIEFNELGEHTPAVHARSTDFNLSYRFYAKKMYQLSEIKFFFTSDSAVFEQSAKKDFTLAVLREKKYPSHRSGFFGFGADIVRRRDDVIDAAIDLRILSSLDLKIYHPGSTYALLAKELATAYRSIWNSQCIR